MLSRAPCRGKSRVLASHTSLPQKTSQSGSSFLHLAFGIEEAGIFFLYPFLCPLSSSFPSSSRLSIKDVRSRKPASRWGKEEEEYGPRDKPSQRHDKHLHPPFFVARLKTFSLKKIKTDYGRVGRSRHVSFGMFSSWCEDVVPFDKNRRSPFSSDELHQRGPPIHPHTPGASTSSSDSFRDSAVEEDEDFRDP